MKFVAIYFHAINYGRTSEKKLSFADSKRHDDA